MTNETNGKGMAWMQGRIMPIEEARLPVNDWGVIHSDITYDVVPVWQGGFFRLDAYMARFAASRSALRMDVGMTEDQIGAALSNMVAASALKNAYVAMVASRGVPLIPGTRDPRECGNHFYAWCVPYIHVIRPELAEKGASAWISEKVRRIPSDSVDPRIKNYHWADFTAGLFEAKDKGAETVILLDHDNNVTEGPGFNVFSVKGNRVITPETGMLEGISRRTVLEMCATLDLETEVRPLPMAEFMESDEVFISTSGGGVAPITQVNERVFSNGAPGAITGKLHQCYWDWIHRAQYRTEIDYGTATEPATGSAP